MIQTLFPNIDAVFQDDSAPIHKPELFSHGMKSMKVNSPDLNNIEPLWSVLETRARNRFSPPTSLKLLEVVLQEEWFKIPPQSVQNLYTSIP
jgi:transposase